MEEGLLIATGYILGSLPFGYWLPRLFRGIDIRKFGSGNVGASNVWRVCGARLGISVGRPNCSTSRLPRTSRTAWITIARGASQASMRRSSQYAPWG